MELEARQLPQHPDSRPNPQLDCGEPVGYTTLRIIESNKRHSPS